MRVQNSCQVSTADQNLDLQHDTLNAAGCFRVFADTASGALDERPALANVLDQLRPGDTLVVWKLDRLGRSLRHLIDTVAEPSVATLASVACTRMASPARPFVVLAQASMTQRRVWWPRR